MSLSTTQHRLELIQNTAQAVWDFLEMDADDPESWYAAPGT